MAVSSENGGQAVKTVEMIARVEIAINNREPIERVTGPGGNEWRSMLYDLHTEQDVLEHWASNAVRNGVQDVSELDGWADVPRGTVTMIVEADPDDL